MICPMKYFYIYVAGKIERIKGYLINGTATHDALDHDMIQKMETKVNMKTSEVLEVFDDRFEKAVALAKDKSREVDWEDTPKAQVKDAGVAALEKYHQVEAPLIQPKEVEKGMTVEFQGTDLRLLVKPDVIDDKDIIIDWKTARKKTEVAVPSSQLGCYQLAHPDAKGLRLDTLIGAKKPDCTVQLYAPNSHETQRKLLQDLSNVEKGIRGGIFPRSGQSWGFLVCRSCAFQPDCWGGPVAYNIPKNGESVK